MYFKNIPEIQESYINQKSLFLTSMLQLCDQTTRQLIDLFNQNRQGQYINQSNIYKILTLRACFGDSESLLFIEKQSEPKEYTPNSNNPSNDTDNNQKVS